MVSVTRRDPPVLDTHPACEDVDAEAMSSLAASVSGEPELVVETTVCLEEDAIERVDRTVGGIDDEGVLAAGAVDDDSLDRPEWQRGERDGDAATSRRQRVVHLEEVGRVGIADETDELGRGGALDAKYCR